MDQSDKDSQFSNQASQMMSRSQKLSDLKRQVTVRGEKFMNAQQEIEQVKVILSDARKRLEIMKDQSVNKLQWNSFFWSNTQIGHSPVARKQRV